MKNLFLAFLFIFLSCSDGHHLDGTGSIQLIGHCKEPLPSMTTYKALGAGTPSDPYLIFSAQQLKSIADDRTAWNKYFEQCTDIDASTVAPFMIGDAFDLTGAVVPAPTAFSGSYNGNNYAINNFHYDDPAASSVGLFRFIDKGIIDQVVMNNVDVSASAFAGGLAGVIMNGTIQNTEVNGKVSIVGSPLFDAGAGLIAAGAFFGKLTHLKTQGTVSACPNCLVTGGVVGIIGNLLGLPVGSILVDDVSSSADITGGSTLGGAFGIIGENSTIKNSHSSGNVTSTSTTTSGSSGGFAGGINGATVIVENCFTTGNVNGSNTGRDVGGFIGGMGAGIIRSCYASGNVSGNGPVGGFAGVMNGSGTIEDSYSLGNVTVVNPPAQDGVGGFVGTIGGTGGSDSITRSYSSGSVMAFNSNRVGGFIGGDFISTASLTSSFATGSVSASGGNVGPFVGSNNTVVHSSSYYLGSAACTGCDNAIGTGTLVLANFYNPNASFGFTWDNVNIWNFGAGLPTLK